MCDWFTEASTTDEPVVRRTELTHKLGEVTLRSTLLEVPSEARRLCAARVHTVLRAVRLARRLIVTRIPADSAISASRLQVCACQQRTHTSLFDRQMVRHLPTHEPDFTSAKVKTPLILFMPQHQCDSALYDQPMHSFLISQLSIHR